MSNPFHLLGGGVIVYNRGPEPIELCYWRAIPGWGPSGDCNRDGVVDPESLRLTVD